MSSSDFFVNQIKQEVLSLCSDEPVLPYPKKTKLIVDSSSQQLNNFNESLSKKPNVTSSEKTKRSYCKPCPKSRKKPRVEDSVDEEKNLDNDLLGIVESIDTDKNLDSDSSNDTIIIDDTVIINDGDSSFNPQSKLSRDTLGKSSRHTSTPFFNSFEIPFPGMQTRGIVQHLTSITKEGKKDRKKSVENKSNVSMLKEILTSPFPQQYSPISYSSQNVFSNSVIIGNRDFEFNPHNKSDTFQSMYASMGLDEDLCDTEQSSNKSDLSKESNQPQLTKVHDNLLPIQIKKEVDDSTFNECNINTSIIDIKNESLMCDGTHVSMTFEAESSYEEDAEDDLPLSLLKNFKFGDLSKSEANSETLVLTSGEKSIDINSTVSSCAFNDISPSIFIKKELLDDENMSDSLFNNVDSFPIKSEPVDVEYFSSESHAKYSSEVSLSQIAACDNTTLSANSSRKKGKKNHSKKTKTLPDLKYVPSVLPSDRSNTSNPDLGNKISASTELKNFIKIENSTSNGKNKKSIKSNDQKISKTINKKDQTKRNSKAFSKTLNEENLSSDINFQFLEKNCEKVENCKDKPMDSQISVEAQNHTSQKKGKRKRPSKNIRIDENLPITLLIKRQKSESTYDDAPDSFLCTDPNRASVAEAHSDNGLVQVNTPHSLQELPVVTGNSNLLLSDITSADKSQKRKKTKKQTKKCSIKKITNTEQLSNGPSSSKEHFNQTTDNTSDSCEHAQTFIMDFELEIQSNMKDHNSASRVKKTSRSKKSKCKSAEKDNECTLSSDLSSEKPKNSNTREFQNKTDSYPYLKNQNAAVNSDKMQVEVSVSSAISQGSHLEIKTSNSEMNNCHIVPDLILNKPIKKKKRRARSNNWYKKKSAKTKRKQATSAETVSDQKAVSEMEITSGTQLADEQPVLNISSNSKVENIVDVALSNDVLLERDTVISFTSDKKGKQSKKKKSLTQLTDFNNEEILLKQSECSNMNNKDTDLEDKSSKDNEESLKKGSAKEYINESKTCKTTINKSSCGEQASECNIPNITGSTSARTDRQLHSINILQMALEMAKIQAMIENQEKNGTHSNVNQGSITGNTEKQLEVLKKVADKNISNSSPVNHNAIPNNAGVSKSLKSMNSLQQSCDIQIKKEIDADPNNSSFKPGQLLQSSLNPIRMTLSHKEHANVNTMCKKVNMAATVKAESNFVLGNSSRHNDTSVPPSRLNIRHVNKNQFVELPEKLNLYSKESSMLKDIPQDSQVVDIPNNIGLSIKEENCHNPKLSSNNCIRNKKDSTNQVSELALSSDVQSGSTSLFPKKPIAWIDDEIQIFVPEPVVKIVPLIDLTQENYLPESTQKEPTCYNNMISRTSDFIQFNSSIKNEKDSVTSSLHPANLPNDIALPLITEEQNSTFSFCKNDVHGNFDISKIGTNVSSSDNIKEVTYFNKKTTERETNNAFIVRDKYIDEYFKHPFPPSVPFCHKKQRNRNKSYIRFDSKAWNLTEEEVASRLKHAGTAHPQFGKKLGDVIKLEKYAVSPSEIEFYHRILGVAPSQRLLSKCYLTPRKNFSTIISKFDKCESSNGQSGSATNASQMPCTIQDILQGITESKRMCASFNTEIKSPNIYGDCPDTKDTFDSCISSATDMPVNVPQNKDVTNPRILPISGNELSSLSKPASLNVQQSSSTYLPAFQGASKNDASVGDISVNHDNALYGSGFDSSINTNISLLQSDILSNLSLPSKEVIDDILKNSNNSQTIPESTPSIALNTLAKSKNFIESNPVPLANSLTQVDSSLPSNMDTDESHTLLNANKAIEVLDLPVTELRKILKTAGSLQADSDKCSTNRLWKSKATFEYNHTQSVPVMEYSEQKFDLQSANNDAETVENISKQPENENSDDEYIDTEPIPYDHGNDDRSDCSSPDKEEKIEESPEIPQYKSKWEKIMERKVQQEHQKINELFIKDCVPVSSRIKVQHKRNSVYSEEFSQDTETSLQKLKRKNTKVKGRKTEGDPGKKNRDFEKPKKVNSNKQKKSQTAKIVIEPKTSEKTNTKNNLTSKISKESDKAANLFVPDKLVKCSNVKDMDTALTKIGAHKKPNEKNKPKRFYGNRVTNRGSFLTETNPSEVLKNIKIPKKNKPEDPKKSGNMRSEEFHSVVKSPDINIQGVFNSKYKKINKIADSRKNSEFYKSPLSDSVPSTTSHFIRTKRMRDREYYLNSGSHYPYQNNFRNQRDDKYSQSRHFSDGNVKNRANSFLRSPNSDRNDESNYNRKSHLETPLSPFQEDCDDGMQTQKFPLQETSTSSSQEGLLVQESPLLDTSSISLNSKSYEQIVFGQYSQYPSTLPSNLPQFPTINFPSSLEPTKDLLQKIMSVFNKNSVSKVALNPDPGNLNVAFNNNDLNLPYGVYQPSYHQNLTSHVNLTVDPVASASNSFRNMSQADSLDPRKAAQRDLPMCSNSPQTCSSDPRRAALGLQPHTSAKSAFFNSPLIDSATQQNTTLGLQPVGYPQYSNIPSTDCLNSPRATFGMTLSSVKNQLSPPQDSRSQILNSPRNVAPNTVSQVSKKAISLVPPHLKTLVGHATIETHNVRLLMLEWSVDWLIQQQKVQDPPPIYNALRKLTSSYNNFEDYYNTYFPLMLLETWHRIYVSWTHLNQTAPFLCQITSYSVKNHYVSVECQTMFSIDARPKGIYPDEGSILMVKYSTKSNNYTIKILGYVTHVKTRRFNPVTDSKICSSLTSQKDINHDSLQILSLTFMVAYNSEDIDKRQPVHIHVLCTVKHSLKQNDAMLYLTKSPLRANILNPVAEGLLTVTLTPRNSPEEKVNECVREITKGILTPHPLPLLTVVRAKPESDRLNIIPLLIRKMKDTYRTKVLLCVRTVRALGDIAANICLQQSLKLVIINKRCDTNPQFQKYLLDELVSNEVKKIEEENVGIKVQFKNETFVKIRKQVLKDCDVVLSLIRNSHDEFMSETFLETDMVAQMCCIVDEANLCTEPETLIPILYRISKLILIGDPDYSAKVLSKTANAYDYNQSLFQRAYDLDLKTD